MNIDLGRVTPIYRGAYDAAESYELNDVVLHTDGNLYWHTSETPTTGVAPTVTATWKLAFSGADVQAALALLVQQAQNAKTAAETAKDKAEDAQAAAESAQTAAETAQSKAEDAQDAAEAAQAAAEIAQGKAEDAQEAAETAAATFSTDATLSVSGKAADAAAVGAFNQYISLREEEDRQILLGSVVQAVEDTYAELSSTPIHTAITIGQSVYPRMDNTRLGLETIKGRTVVDDDVLVAPVVSGVKVSGFNTWDETWRLGYYGTSSGSYNTANDQICTEFIPVLPNTTYYKAGGGSSSYIKFYDSNKAVVGNYADTRREFTTPDGCYYITISFGTSYGTAYKNDTCINISNASLNGQYRPYVAPTSLPIPSTTLNGVGEAQDYIEAVEVAENDYSLIKRSVMGSVDLGSLTWTTQSLSNNRTAFKVPISALPSYPQFNTIEPPNAISPVAVATYQNAPAWGTNVFVFVTTSATITGDTLAFIFDASVYSDETAFKTAMNGKYLAYEVNTPTQTTVAEHLTLAEVSAIAQNGGIVSIVNSNGEIVQPDLTVDAVVIKSAS